MKFNADGWAMINDGDAVLFHRQNLYGEDMGYYRYDLHNIAEISKKQYFQTKYGNACESIIKRFGDDMTDSDIAPDGSIYVSHFQDSIIYHFGADGQLLHTYEIELVRLQSGIYQIGEK